MVQGDSEAFLESQSKPSFAGLTLKPEAEAHMNGANGAAAGSSSAAAAAPVANDATEARTPASAAIAAEEKAPGLLAVAAKSPAAPAPAAAASPATSESTAAAAATDKAAAEPAAAAAADKPATEKKTVSLFGGYDTNQTNPFQATFTATSGGFGSALASNSNSLFGSSAPGTLTAFTSFASSSGTKWGSPSAAKVCMYCIVLRCLSIAWFSAAALLYALFTLLPQH
jgi:hypothetical protein